MNTLEVVLVQNLVKRVLNFFREQEQILVNVEGKGPSVTIQKKNIFKLKRPLKCLYLVMLYI